MLNKTNLRKKYIEKLVKSHEIEDQETLVQLLKEKFNIKTNQVAVSRDLKELSIYKKPKNNVYIYSFPEENEKKAIIKLAIKSIQHNESTIVINCMPGLSDFIGDYIDTQKNTDILGTLAGENVVFVAPKSTKNIKHTFINLCKLLDWKAQ